MDPITPLQDLLANPKYAALEPDKKVAAIRNWEQDVIDKRNAAGDWDMETKAIFDVESTQARQAALGIEPMSPQAILESLAVNEEEDRKTTKLFEALEEVEAAEREKREINSAKFRNIIGDESGFERSLEVADDKIRAIGKRVGFSDLDEARQANEVIQNKRDAAVVRGKLVVKPDLYFDREAFVETVKNSSATPREKARVLAEFTRSRENLAKETLPEFKRLTSFNSFAKQFAAENGDVTNGDVIAAFKQSGSGDWEKTYNAMSRGLLSGIEGVGYTGVLAGDILKKMGDQSSPFSTGIGEKLGLAKAGSALQDLAIEGPAGLADTAEAKQSISQNIETLGGLNTAQKLSEVGAQLGTQIFASLASGAATAVPGAVIKQGARKAAKGAMKSSLGPEVAKKIMATGAARKLNADEFMSVINTNLTTFAIPAAGSAGPKFYESYERHRDKLAASGLAGEELEEAARSNALTDATRTGIITGAVTRLFGLSGVEGVGRLTQVAGNPTAREALAKGTKEFAKSVTKSALGEGFEEALDEGINGALDALLENPDMTFREWEEQVLFAGFAGAVFGAAVEAPVQFVENAANVARAQIANSPEMVARNAKAAELREQGLDGLADKLEEANVATESAALADALDEVEADVTGTITRIEEIDAELSATDLSPDKLTELRTERESLLASMNQGTDPAAYNPEAVANKAVADLVSVGMDATEARQRVVSVVNQKYSDKQVTSDVLAAEAESIPTPLTESEIEVATGTTELIDSKLGEVEIIDGEIEGLSQRDDREAPAVVSRIAKLTSDRQQIENEIEQIRKGEVTTTEGAEVTTVTPVTPVKAEPTFRSIVGRPATVEGETGDIRIDADGVVVLDRGPSVPPIEISRNPDDLLSTSDLDVALDEEGEADFAQAQAAREAIGSPLPTPATPITPATPARAPRTPQNFNVREDGAVVTMVPGGEGQIRGVSDFVASGFTEDTNEFFVTVKPRNGKPDFDIIGDDAIAIAETLRRNAASRPVTPASQATETMPEEAQEDLQLTAAIAASVPEPVLAFDRILTRLILDKPTLNAALIPGKSKLTKEDLDVALEELTTFQTQVENENFPPDIKARLDAIVDESLSDLTRLSRRAKPAPAPRATPTPDDAGRGTAEVSPEPVVAGEEVIVDNTPTEQNIVSNERTTQSNPGSVGTERSRFSEPGRVSFGTGPIQAQDLAYPSPSSLEGLPATVTTKERGKLTFGAFEPAREAARQYAATAGIPYNPPTTYKKVDAERAARIATEFENMVHNPEDPATRESYEAMISETLAQWQAVKATGLVVEPITADMGGDPYGNPRFAIVDVVENNHLWFYPTDFGFGSNPDIDISGNPLFEMSDEFLNGQQLRYNDLFRIVHDYFGHIKEGVGFRADGEENAWRAHSAMYSEKARPAMTTETRGQNSWVNFGPYTEFNKTATQAETVYAPQKIGLLPEWVMTEGLADEAKPGVDPNRIIQSAPVDESATFGDGATTTTLTDPETGGFIKIVDRNNGTPASVVELLVPENARRQGVGSALQAKAQEVFPNLQGQVSSKSAARSAYRLGRRPYGRPEATLEETLDLIDQNSSVNMVTPAPIAEATPPVSFDPDTTPLDASPVVRQPKQTRGAIDDQYFAAIEAGDMDAVQRMVDEAANNANNITEAYHFGGFDQTENPIPDTSRGMHFGTRNAAEERAAGKPVDDFIEEASIEFDDDLGAWFWSSQGVDSYDLNEEGFASEAEARSDLENSAQDYASSDDFDPLDSGVMTRVYLRIENPMRSPDLQNNWDGAVDRAIRNGHDAIEYVNQFEDKGSTSYIILNPNQIKSAAPVTYDAQGNIIPLSQRFNPNSDSILEAAPWENTGFYSKLTQVVTDKLPNRATPQQILATLDPTRGSGVKAEEIKWSGIEQAVDRIAADNNGMVPKQELIDYLNNEGAVKFEEVVTKDNTKPTIRSMKDGDEDGFALYDGDEFVEWYETREEAEANIPNLARVQGPDAVQYGQYQLPGGTNYKEVVLSMPDRNSDALLTARAEYRKAIKEGAPEATLDMMSDRVASLQPIDSYTSSHFTKVPNYVAHMRTNERTDSDGRSGLFIEEIQSDRHQAGRKTGYRGESRTQVEIGAELDALDAQYEAAGNVLSPREWETLNDQIDNPNATDPRIVELNRVRADLDGRIAELRREYNAAGPSGVVDAPFRKDWHLAMFKRALRDAVASGKEWIGWTTGETQNDRFDLSKQVDLIEYAKSNSRPQSEWHVTAYKNGEEVINQNATPEQLPDLVGKDVAERLINGDQTRYDEDQEFSIVGLRGNDLKVGGSGMKGFYDNMLPKEIGKYVKQWGGRVEQETIGTSGDASLNQEQEYNYEKIDSILRKGGEVYFVSNRTAGEELIRDHEDFANYLDEWGTPTYFIQGDKGPQIPIWKISITPEMKRSVQSGQPLFAQTSSNFTAETEWTSVVTSLVNRAIQKYPNIPIKIDTTSSSLARTQGLDMTINPVMMAESTAGMGPAEAAQIIDKIIIHEATHRAALTDLDPEFPTQYAAQMTVDEKLDTARGYLHRSAYATDEAYNAAVRQFAGVEGNTDARAVNFKLGHEALRMLSERLRTGYTTEETIAFLKLNPNLLQRALRYLKAYVNRLKAWATTRKDPSLYAEMSTLNKAVWEMERGPHVERGAEPFVVPGSQVTPAPMPRTVFNSVLGREIAVAASPVTTNNQDSDYLAAVESGDMAAAQRMVDEAARATKIPKKRLAKFHDHPDMNQVDARVRGMAQSYKDEGAEEIYFDTNYAGQAYGFSTDGGDAFEINVEAIDSEDSRKTWGDPYRITVKNGSEIKEVSSDLHEITDYQLVASDAVAYDAQGNIIPLSQRFNPSSDSILEASPFGKPSRVPIRHTPEPGKYKEGGWLTAAFRWDPRVFEMLQKSRNRYQSLIKEAEFFHKDLNAQLKKNFGKKDQWPTDTVNLALGNTDNRMTEADVEAIKKIKSRGLAAAQGTYLRARALAKQQDDAGMIADAALTRQDARAAFDAAIAAYQTQARTYEDNARIAARVRAEAGRDAAINSLPDDVQVTVRKMRLSIDALSRELVRSGAIPDDLRATIDANQGLWLHRSYRIFDQENYAEWIQESKDPEAETLRNKTLTFVRDDLLRKEADKQIAKNPSLSRTQAMVNAKTVVTNEDVTKAFNGFLHVADGGVKSLLAGATISKDVDALMKRGVIPKEIQELWGVYTDPTVNAAKSLGAVAQFVTQQQFLTNLVDLGTSEGWLSKDQFDAQGNRLYELAPNNGMSGRYNGSPSTQWAPLSGYYGPRALADAIAASAKDLGGPAWMKFVMQLTGYSMASKTVLSWQSVMRNFWGNILFTIANGNLLTRNAWKTMNKSRQAAWSNFYGSGTDATRARVKRLIELGVFGDAMTENLIRDLTNGFESDKKAINFFDKMAEKTFLSKVTGGAGKVFKTSARFYSTPDEFWKVVAFEGEISRVEKYMPNATVAEQEEEAARIVKATMPTYSQAPEIVQLLRRNPFIAPFITFTTEVYRTSVNTVKLAAGQITEGIKTDNKELLADGLHRTRGIMLASAGVYGVTLLFRSLAGFDAEDEDDLRNHVPVWDENSTLMLLPTDRTDGKIDYMNISYMNPYDVWSRPFRALVRGLRDPDSGILETSKETLQELFDPVLSEQIFAGSILDVARGVTLSGKEIYDKTDSDADKITQSLQHIFKQSLMPGTLSSAERIVKASQGYVAPGSGRSYDKWNEIFSGTLGMKVSSIDTSSTLQFSAKQFKANRSDSIYTFSKPFKSNGTQSDEDIADAYIKANAKLKRSQLELYKNMTSAVRLGTMTQREALRQMKADGVTDEMITDIAMNRFRRYEPSTRDLNEAKKKGDKQGQDRIAIYRAVREEVPRVEKLSEEDL